MGRPIGLARRAFDAFQALPTTTVEGRFFLGGLVALGFLATRTDRNYVLLVLGALLAVIFVSILFSTWNLRGIRFERQLPDAVIAGEPFTVRVRITNLRRWMPARGVELKDALQSTLSGGGSVCFAARIPAGGRATFVYTARIRRRGAYNITNALLTTRFPFGLFAKRSLARHPNRIVVYPRAEEVAPDHLPGTRDQQWALSQSPVRRAGGDEFHSLRDYRPGDDPRRIAWRVSARQGRLVLKEFEQENRGHVAVLLATSLSGVSAARRRVALERSVTLAASLVRHFHHERRPFLFAAPGVLTEVFQRADAVHECLEHLATIRSDPAASPDALLAEVGPRALRGRDVILLTAGPPSPGTLDTPGFRLHIVSVQSRGARRLLKRGWA